MSRIRFVVPFALSLLVLPQSAKADDPPELPTDDATDVDRNDGWEVFGGEQAAVCSWPNTVAMLGNGSLCSGTLVHPEVVLYAAHCGSNGTQVRFGERSSGGSGKTITPEFCETNPGFNTQGNDWAFCKLAEPVTEVPPTPVLFGCEGDLLQDGGEIYVVGFGGTDQGGAGTKFWAQTVLNSVNVFGGTIRVGGNGNPSVCPGDSGGPAFIRHPEQGTWHHVGIASTVDGLGPGQECLGVTATHALSASAVSWVEERSGVDITPCFDQNGNWNPGPLCGDYWTGEPGVGEGTFNTWCDGTPRSSFSATCGDAFFDDVAPTVSITAPEDGTVYDDAPAEVSIAINAEDDSGFVKEVGLIINGEEQPVYDTEAPYEFGGVVFPEGQYTLQAVARDYSGNETVSESVGVGVGQDAPVNEEEGDEGEDGGGEGTGETGFGGQEEDGGGGCSCSAPGTAGSAPLGVLLLGGLGLARARRRRG